MRAFEIVWYAIEYIFVFLSSLYGPPVNKVADQKAKEILDDPEVFWYLLPNRLGTPSWHYGNILTAKLKNGTEANFLIDGDHPLCDQCTFYFFDEPNKRLRLHWKTQIEIDKVARNIKKRNRLHLSCTRKDQEEELAQLTEERISQL